MNERQFQAITRIARIGKHSQASKEAMRDVKMNGMSQKEAAEKHDLKANNVSTLCARFDHAVKLAFEAITGEEYKA